jgi:hypothetical protein
MRYSSKKLNEATIKSLLLRLDELEAKVKKLDGFLQATQAKPQRDVSPSRASKGSRVISKNRAQCPGCYLELPKGRRSDSCVWCGFSFEAARPRVASRQASTLKVQAH